MNNSHDIRPAALRAFVAARLDAELLDKITAQQRRIEAKLARAPVRWTRPEQLHLTLHFLGNVQVEAIPALHQALSAAAQGIAPFRLALGTLGCFPNWRRPSVIWLGLQGELAALQRLQEAIRLRCQTFGSHAEERAFHPHLTIGRVKPAAQPARALGEVIQSEPAAALGGWHVDRVTLMRSELRAGGSIYTVLADVPLAG